MASSEHDPSSGPTTASSTALSPAIRFYSEQARRYSDQRESCAEQDRLFSWIRVALFGVLVAAIVMAVGINELRRPGLVAAGVSFLVFLAVAAAHERLLERQGEAFERQRINEHLIARLKRRWDDCPWENVDLPPADAVLARDLDLFGRASLFQFLCPITTPIGAVTLQRWLLEPTSPAEIRDRQAAVKELVSAERFREELQWRSRMVLRGTARPDRFMEWAEGPVWLRARLWLLGGVRILAVVTCALLALALLGVLEASVAGVMIFAAVVVNVVVSVVWLSAAHDTFNRVSTRRGEIQHYRALFELLYEVPAPSRAASSETASPRPAPRVTISRLAKIKDAITSDEGGVRRELGKLGWIMFLAGLRHSALAFVFVYLPAQVLLLWDFHVLDMLERWKIAHGARVRTWFEGLGEIEALACLASLAHDCPDWAWPEIDETADRLAAQGLGHPLLPDGARVANDVECGPPGTVLLVTGSNMSGKSTLLRAIGVNTALAQAGGPVCARSLRLPPVDLATSMRVRDSLAEGVSFYMAELRRLKEIVDAARHPRPGRRMLYLLDEILQGTNSRERHLAVVRVLEHLIREQAIGAVSTHDLELATSHELVSHCLPFHFREELHDNTSQRPMTFDYCLRPGVATTTNALKLLELVGLG